MEQDFWQGQCLGATAEPVEIPIVSILTPFLSSFLPSGERCLFACNDPVERCMVVKSGVLKRGHVVNLQSLEEFTCIPALPKSYQRRHLEGNRTVSCKQICLLYIAFTLQFQDQEFCYLRN